MTVLLADTSVWHRRANADVVERWTDAVLADTVGTTQPVRLEVLYSAKSARDYEQIDDELDGLIQFPCTVEAMDRALQVQRKLSKKGGLHHRSVRIPDLLIAAAAELAEAVVWHYDEDFDRIATVTGQAAEWIVPRGSL